MPFYKQISLPDCGSLMLWKVEEEESPAMNLTENSLKRLAGMKRSDHRMGFLAVRMLLELAGLSDSDVFYEPGGRPFLKDGRHISISHSRAFAALYVGREPRGIDIEKVHPRIVINQSYFIGNEVIPAEAGPEMLTVIWTVKEAIFKLSNSRPLSFLNDLHVSPFDLKAGSGIARSTFPGWEKEFSFQFELIEDYILTICKE